VLTYGLPVRVQARPPRLPSVTSPVSCNDGLAIISSFYNHCLPCPTLSQQFPVSFFQRHDFKRYFFNMYCHWYGKNPYKSRGRELLTYLLRRRQPRWLYRHAGRWGRMARSLRDGGRRLRLFVILCIGRWRNSGGNISRAASQAGGMATVAWMERSLRSAIQVPPAMIIVSAIAIYRRATACQS